MVGGASPKLRIFQRHIYTGGKGRGRTLMPSLAVASGLCCNSVKGRLRTKEGAHTMSEKVYRSELTPVDFLRRSAYMFPEKTAVVYGERRYTYRELEERVDRLASRLRDAGLQKGDRVAFLCPNTPPMLEGTF